MLCIFEKICYIYAFFESYFYILRYARENLALVNVYIKDPAVTRIKRDQKVPLIWFVANIGGILGLTMGMSLRMVSNIEKKRLRG